MGQLYLFIQQMFVQSLLGTKGEYRMTNVWGTLILL